MEKKIIGQRIKEVVISKKITHKEFAELLSVSDNYVFKIYNKSSLDTKFLEIISKALNHNFFEDIINGIVEMDNSEVMKDFYNRRAVSQFHEIEKPHAYYKNLS